MERGAGDVLDVREHSRPRCLVQRGEGRIGGDGAGSRRLRPAPLLQADGGQSAGRRAVVVIASPGVRS